MSRLKRHKVRTEFLTASRFGAIKRTGYRLIDGYRLPYNINGWFSYYNKLDKAWYLIDGRSGYAVGSGTTMLGALHRFLSDEVRRMTWCAKSANKPHISRLPIVEESRESH